MSEKTEVDQEYEEDGNKSPSSTSSSSSKRLPEHQYSRDQLMKLSESPLACQRPKCLERAYDSDDGRWDPDRWYKAKFGSSREASPLTLADGKDRRRVNDPAVDRLKEEQRDDIVLSPQRRSFGTGCHVQAPAYTRQLSMPERDRDDSRGERDRDRDRDRPDRPLRKIGSGRIQIDRENSRDFSRETQDRENDREGIRDLRDRDRVRDRDLRDRDRDRDPRDLRNRDFAWSRDRDRDRDRLDWDRDVRGGDLREPDWDRDRDRDRRFDRSDRFRRPGDRDFPDRDRRDFRDRDRGFERNSRRRGNYHHEEKEPEWFSGGPTSQSDTIELKGFDKEGDDMMEENGGRRSLDRGKPRDDKKRVTRSEEKSSNKGSSEEASEADVKVSQRSSPEDDQQESQQNQKDIHVNNFQKNAGSPPASNEFDFEEILKAALPLDEEGVRQASRFSQFFAGSSQMDGSMMGNDAMYFENMLVPQGLLEDGRPSPTSSSPVSMLGHMGAMHPHLGHPPHGTHHYADPHHQQLQGGDHKENMYSLPHHMGSSSVPNSAGDNNAGLGKPALPPSVTALFNSAAMGGSNASISSNSSFSTQDAEAQLKAMLFGGPRDSASSSGTASPANLPASVQRKVKTVAELEADMHQNSPQKINSPTQHMSGGGGGNNNQGGDMTAFNKLLIMMNAASEANQNSVNTAPQMTRPGHGMLPSHSEFSHAVMKNKEEQMQLLQQSLQNANRQGQPQQGVPLQIPQHHHQMPPPIHMQQHQQQQPPPPMSQAAAHHQLQKQQQQQMLQQSGGKNIQQHGMPNKPNTPGVPQAMSTPHPVKPRAQNGSGAVSSSDPIYNLIQQNPTIVMKPASPAGHMAAMLAASQQSAVSNTARVPSPLMFSQQPPLHLNAPSPIHPGQLSPRTLTVGANMQSSTLSSPSGMRSPVMPRGLSPQELSVHAQAVMQGALIKKQLQDQSERYLKKQQERDKSPNLHQQQQQPINVIKPPPSAQSVLPPTPQPKGSSLNTFTPTSVLRKMHSDKAAEKEKQAQEGKHDDETEYMPSMRELSGVAGHGETMDGLDGLLHHQHHKDTKLVGDLSDISFLDPVNPNLVAMSGQLDQMRIGQTNVLPGTLSQPMSVEEKMKLSALAEKPGTLSQMLDLKAAAERAGQHGRPIVKAPEVSHEDRVMQQAHMLHQHQMQEFNQHQQPPPPPPSQQQQPPPNQVGGRPVTGGSVAKMQPQPKFSTAPPTPTSMAPQNMQPNLSGNKPVAGRAIVGGNSVQQQQQLQQQQMMSGVPVSTAQSVEMMRLMEQQQQMQRLQQVSQAQGMGIPPPSIPCMGPPPMGIPVSGRIPMVATSVHSPNAVLMQQQFARVNAQAQRNQQFNQYMAMQQAHVAQQQNRGMGPLPPLHTVVSAPLSPRTQASGPLSPAALSATLQRVASPHGKMNGPMPPNAGMNGSNGGGGGANVDMSGGIQRWFSPDILRTQLPRMPPLPTQGNHVMTVDELERN